MSAARNLSEKFEELVTKVEDLGVPKSEAFPLDTYPDYLDSPVEMRAMLRASPYFDEEGNEGVGEVIRNFAKSRM